jgi:iron complex outermembrane receptor protein
MAILPTGNCHASENVSAESATESSPIPDGESNNEAVPDTTPEPSNEASAEIEEDSLEDIGYHHVISEEYFFSDLPIVFTATRLEQSVSETPVSMTIIDEEMIKASGALEIAELMRLVPGMQVANYGGDEYFVTYHGRADLYSRSLQVLVDGRSIYNPVIGGVAWSDLPLAMEDIERIEIIRGSNAAAFGSNSFSGVINIITKDPSKQQGTLIKTTLGNKNTRQITARNAGSIGDLDYRLTINYDEKDGIKTRHDDATNKWLSFRGDYQYDTSNHITFQTGFSKGTQQAGFEDSIWNIPRDTDSSSSFQQIKWTYTEDKDTEYSLHFFHNHKELNDTYSFPFPNPFYVVGGFSYESDRYEMEFQHKLKPTSDWRLAWGVGMRHDNTVSPTTLNQDSAATRNQVHAFANAEWKPMDDLTVNLGAMLEKYEGFSSLFSPRVALNYALKDNHIFRISYSTAYRMPNVWEEQIDMKFRYLSNIAPPITLHQTTDVPEPEKINSIELGYMAAFKDIPLTMDVKLFKEHISPVINYAYDYTTRTGNFYNDHRVDITGLELQLDYQPTNNTNIHAVYSRLHASGSQVKRYDSGTPLEYIDVSEIVPTETYGILASHRFDNGIQVSSGFYHTDSTAWLEPGDETDSYNKWDFRIGKTFTLPDAIIDVSAIVHNVSNESYQEYYNINEAQREVYLQIGVKF